MFQDLTDFEVVPTCKIREVTFDINSSGSSEPVARMVAGKYDEFMNPYTVFVGPGLETVAGVIVNNQAYDKGGVRIGGLDYKYVRHMNSGADITFRQNDMMELVGKQVGMLGKIRELPLVGVLDNSDFVGGIVLLRYRFRGSGSPGFEMTKTAGVSNRYHFSVHDPKINRLMVLACYALLEGQTSKNPMKGVNEFAKGFTADYWRGPKRRRPRSSDDNK